MNKLKKIFKEQEYYSIKNILKTLANYMLIIGERSNGKSYSPKEYAIYCAYHKKDMYSGEVLEKRYKMAYIRRWKEEIKNADVEKYFADMGDKIKEITEGKYDCVVVQQRTIYLAKVNESGVAEKGNIIGDVFALTSNTHYKSLAYPDIYNIIFEEFITDEGYLPRECNKLMSIVSTIARRDRVNVFMIGNTINRMCPYFREWNLGNVKKQKQGTIELYKQKTDQIDEFGNEISILIAVEYSDNYTNNSKMFFGTSAKTITTGTWDTDIYPHLYGKLNTYKCYYRILYKYNDFQFVICLLKDTGEGDESGKTKGDLFLFVYPSTRERDDIKRIIDTEFSTSRLTSYHLTPLTKYDKIVIRLIEDRKIRFADNLTGTEFWQIKKERGGRF